MTHLLTQDPARLQAVLDEIPGIVAVFRGPELILELANALALELSAGPASVGCPAEQVFREGMGGPGMELYAHRLREVLETGRTVHGWASPASLADRPGTTYWDYSFIPMRDDAGDVTGVFVHAVEVTRLVAARRRAEEAEHRFTTLFDANVIGVSITGEHELLEANDAFLAMIGRTREELESGRLRWTDITAPESAAVDARAMAALRAEGVAPPYEKEYVRPDGSRVPVLLSGSRLSADPLRVLATIFDLTERKAVEREIATLLERERDARFAAELASARMGRLQEITAGLSAANSTDAVARAALHHALEALSASAGLLVRGGPGDPQLGHAVGLPPAAVEQWRQFPAALPAAAREALAGRRPVELTGDAVARSSPELVIGTRPGSVVAMPLAVGGRTLGAMLLVFREPRRLDGDDGDFLAALCQQTAAALDRVGLFENRAYVARKLQEGLLPQRLAEVPGAEIAVVYESISGGGEVGGDFYDVFELDGGQWAVAVGDVCGKGTEAAVVTGLARHTVRAVARLDPDPARVLQFLNGALRRHAGAPAFCTVGMAVLSRAADGGFDAVVSSGGHPFPLLVRPGGEVEPVPVSGTMLGVAEDPVLQDARVHVAPAEALMLVTDGVMDARRRGGERFGEQRMLATVRAAAGGSAADIAGAVEAAVRAHHPGPPADDRAIVVLRALPR